MSSLDMLRLTLLASALTTINAASTSRIPSSAPAHAVDLPKDFLGISIESANVDKWTGLDKPNPFVQQTLGNLAGLTGVATPVRIGGTPQDDTYLVWDGSLSSKLINATFPPASARDYYPAASEVHIDPKVFSLSSHLPAGTKVTWGINLKTTNETETLEQAKAVYASFGRDVNGKSVKLERIELGNEPDFFASTLILPPGVPPAYSKFDIIDYSSKWKRIAGSIVQAIQRGQKALFMYGSFVQITDKVTWSASYALGSSDLWQTDLTKSISAYSNHLYFGAFMGSIEASPKPGYLLNRNYIRGNVSSFSEGAKQLKQYGIQTIMGETNSAARHGIPNVSDTAEAAIWLVDYALQLAFNGFSRAHFHNGIGYHYALIQPVAISEGPKAADRPKIQAPYYGAYIVNEFIGKEQGTQLVELTQTAGNVAGYAVFAGSKAVRALFINYDQYRDASTSRSEQQITLEGLSSRGVTVKRFYTPTTGSLDGMTWGGLSLEAPSGAVTGKPAFERLSSNTLTIKASEIIMLTL